MKQQKVSFPNQDGLALAALLDLPEDEAPLAFAIFAHCFTCTKQSAAAGRISRALSQQRIAVLRFDFTGLGESAGDFASTTFSHNVADLVAAARYLEETFTAPQILIGHSLGGAAVLQAASRIATVRAVVTLAAPCHPDHLLKLLGDSRAAIERQGQATVDIGGRPFTLGKEFVDDLLAQEPLTAIGRLKVALLVMHSPQDKIVGIDHAAAIYRAARHPKSFISLDPADHLLSRAEDSRFAAAMIGVWVRRFLDSDENATTDPEISDNRVTARTGAEGFRTDVFVNGHALVADEPEAFGGTNQGPSPYDYLQVALGACTGMTVQMYAARKKWPLESVVVRLRHEKIHAQDCADCDDPAHRIDHLERELEIHGALNQEQRERLLEISEKCPVHRTLHGEVKISTRLREASSRSSARSSS
ncbi:bifunctional alpha/beta hydrolase/OsmC family protein [Desulfuromonas carbonis]|uniref:bifunctional alpha/beta hydrolase/OsmC family protein n=1 Tax=Desulfuromonas sp. DDH964 TaxID=1823759 RepID=UPI00078D4983|nr:bifunctional alpha/beta hydrolase/OsmC family protein [Desulfuromonas sp. DDH964]AMV70515.1 hydrolase [Desulfuromonas sp. DDH964]